MPHTFVVLTAFAVSLLSVSAEIVLKDNGYEGIVVAIHNSIQEDLKILENIKDLFRSGSKFLYGATNRMAYFRSITIALPAHWSDQDEYIRSTGNQFPGANVRIDSPNPEYKDEPYTLQPGGCGDPGRYIHLTTNYVRSLYNNKEIQYEQPGKRLVHEWAHLRYGVFDENGYPNHPKYPIFYRDGGVSANTCVRNIQGTMLQPDGGPCEITEGDIINLTNCTFEPYDDNEVKSSLMFTPYVPSIVHFCDEDNHNTVAPNKQNEMCKSESVWTVMKRHEDFRTNRPTVLKEEQLKPEFRIVKAKKDDRGRYVLVLDVSGSMKGRPLDLLKDAAARLISDVVKDGSFLGLVSFRDTAQQLSPLVQVSNETRELLVSKLPWRADGKTAIGRGLQVGAEVLQANDNVTDGALIVLLTDGEENVYPFMSEVVPEIQKRKIIVNCIAFGSDASHKLEDLAKSTGGKSFLVSDISGNKPIMVLDSAFRESIVTTMGEEEQPVMVVQDDLDLYLPQTELGIDLDPQLGLNTVFSLDVTGLEPNSVDMTVSSPKGDVYGPQSGNDVYTNDKDHIKVAIPTEADPGKYNVKVINKLDKDISASLSVTSEPRDPDDAPIRVRSWLSDIQVTYPGRIKVFAEVKRGYDPVLGATVTATVRQTSSLEEVDMFDNGIGPDTTENDGIYTAFISHFDGNGRYGVVSRVTSTGNAKMKFISDSANKSNRKVRAVAEHKDPDKNGAQFLVTLPPFQRTAEAGTFLVQKWRADVPNIFPPDKVRDLKVTEKKMDTSHHKLVTLQWTSPGNEDQDDADTRVDLRASCSLEDIIKHFEDAFVLNHTWIANGSLSASPTQEKQTVTVKVPQVLIEDPQCTFSSVESYYFALRLYRDSGIPGDISVVTAAHFQIRSPIRHAKLEQDSIYWYVAGGVTLLVLFLVGILICLKVRKKKKVVPCDNEMYL